MPNNIKKELAKKAVSRGSSGLYFIDDILIIPDIFHTLPCTDSFPTTS